jgi:streptogramin lyase
LPKAWRGLDYYKGNRVAKGRMGAAGRGSRDKERHVRGTAKAPSARSRSAKFTRLRMRFGIPAALLAVIALALPSFASADPLGSMTLFSSGLRGAGLINQLTPGPDGNVWFVESSAAPPGIGWIAPSGEIKVYEAVTDLPLVNEEGSLVAITVGPEGKLWFTDKNETTPAIGVIDPANPEGAEEFSIEEKGGNAGAQPQGIVAGPDGNLWFADKSETTPAIGMINPTTHEVKEFSIQEKGGFEGSQPHGIVVGSDGNLWFTDTGATRGIGRINPTTHEIKEFATGEGSEPGGSGGETGPWGIATGPDGNVWFTESGSNTTEGRSATGRAIGRITPSGTITYFSSGLVASSFPWALTAAGGKLWFTDKSGVNETQGLVIEATSGTYKLGFEGKETGAIGKGDLTISSKEVKNVSASSGAFVKGEEISGTGIPAGTFIEKTGTGKVFLTQAATETKTGVSLTANLSVNVNANNTNATIKLALEKLSTIGEENVVVSGTGFTSPIKRTITFEGELSNTDVPQISCNGAGLTGTCAVTTVNSGVSNAIGSISTSGKITEELRSELHWGASLGITNGPGGNVWFSTGLFSVQQLGKYGIEPPGPTNKRTLILKKSAGGTGGTGSVTSKPKGINCATACNEAVASMYENSTVVLKAKAATGSTIASWTGCDSSTGVGGIEGTCTVEIKDEVPGEHASYEVKVAWSGTSKAIANPQALTLSKGESEKNRGYGTVKATGLTCESECAEEVALYQGPNIEKAKPGKTVILKEVPVYGSEFTGWTGCESNPTPSECLVTMESAKSVTAEFAAKPTTTLTVDKLGTGTGTVTSKPKAISCATVCTTQDATVPTGEAVILKEKPALGMTFEGWTGACVGAGETCTVSLSEAGTVHAKFGGAPKAIANPQKLTLNKSGSGYGTIKATGLTCEALCTSTVSLYQGPNVEKAKPGKTVILKATPAPGSKAVEWTGCESNPSPSECSVTMETAKTVTATFDELE